MEGKWNHNRRLRAPRFSASIGAYFSLTVAHPNRTTELHFCSLQVVESERPSCPIVPNRRRGSSAPKPRRVPAQTYSESLPLPPPPVSLRPRAKAIFHCRGRI